MNQPMPIPIEDDRDPDRRILGVTRRQRFRAYFWIGVILMVGFLIWALFYLRPDRWYTYTDQVAFEQVARDVEPGYVLWEKAEPVGSGLAPGDDIATPVVSSNGARMIYSAGEKDGNANLFLREWDGTDWKEPRPMRALNSSFHELAPSLSGNGELLYFTSDRPGGQGGFDIWVSKWDGSEYAWPLPLTPRVNTPFDEIDPDFAPDNLKLYFASNRPRRATDTSEKVAAILENVEDRKGNFDLYSADTAGGIPPTVKGLLKLQAEQKALADSLQGSESPPGEETATQAQTSAAQAAQFLRKAAQRLGDDELPDPIGQSKEALSAAIHEMKKVEEALSEEPDMAREQLIIRKQANVMNTGAPVGIIVERQLSMLYSLRESALADTEIMAKLGGTPQTEAAVDKGLAYLASTQEEDGRWNIAKSGGQGNHDQAATAFALLAFYGRGEVHDEECKYQDTVKRGIEWLHGQRNVATGDFRGTRPQGNAMYDHGIASLAVVEAFGVTKDTTHRAAAQSAIDFIVATQHEEGGWRYTPNQKGDLSVTGWYIMALASAKMSGLEVPDKTMEGAAKFLASVSHGKNKGAYGYTGPGGGTPAMNAAGFFCSQLLGHSSNTSKAYESSVIVDRQAFQLNDIYYAYYGTVASYQHQGPAWRKWMGAMQPAFVKAQNSDGSWNTGGGHGGAMGKVIVTALVTLCLEAHYRYTPLYGLGWEPDPEGPTGNSRDLADLAETPLFRHAKFLKDFSSPANDTGPVLTDHGDFLYFASERDGGEGGADIWRSRIKRTRVNEPVQPKNLGPEINGEDDETNPAVRNAGFHLLFNSDRENNRNALYSARSKRVVRRFDLTKMPDLNWIMGNMLWILGLLASLIGFVWLTRRALTAGKEAQASSALPDDAPPDPAA